jgi:hypothetical protein
MRAILVCIIVGLLCGCGTKNLHSTATILTSGNQVAARAGQTVTLRGVVTNTKIPTILGVDVQSNDPDLRGQLAEATGVLQRWVVTPESLAELQRNGPVANRGTGTFYRLKALDSDYEAAARPASR